MRRLGSVLALALLTATLVSCVPRAAPLAIDELPGTSLERAKEQLPEDNVLTVIDASVEFGREPAYDANPGLEGRWIVIAACADASTIADAEHIELAVAPVEAWEATDPSTEDLAGYAEYVSCEAS